MDQDSKIYVAGNRGLVGSAITRRLQSALALREALYAEPFYRLVFGEGDALPGLVIDRYGDVCVVQITTAGLPVALP